MSGGDGRRGAGGQDAGERTQPEVAPAQATPATTPPVNVTALVAEAASKSGLLWVTVEGRARAAWHVWDGERIWLVSGPGEQHLPALPDRVDVTFRSTSTGGRLATVATHTQVVAPDTEEWEAGATALKASRLNATDDVLARWREQCTVYALRPFGMPGEAPGRHSSDRVGGEVLPSAAATATFRPRHLGGRRGRRGGRSRTGR
ncbi:hypothetical protein [Janibacter sp. G56]|uniref:hypothetical protein n=1 Tax=Janibacter sp. G56 TaxID=3418717 RepID=UPI003D0927A0